MTDLLIGGFLLYAGINGWIKGMVRQLILVLGVILAYWIAKTFYSGLVPFVSEFVSVPSFSQGFNDNLQTGVAFVILFVIIFLAVRFAGSVLNYVSKKKGMTHVNRVSGAVIGVLLAIFLSALVVHVLTYVPNAELQTSLEDSKIKTYVLDEMSSILPFSSKR